MSIEGLASSAALALEQSEWSAGNRDALTTPTYIKKEASKAT